MKNINSLKNSLLILLLIFGLSLGTFANAQRSIAGNITTILGEISELATEFNLTNKQKTEMRGVLMNYLPSIALKASAMLSNRQDLLAISISQDNLDEDALTEIAEKQGQLVTNLIIIKEHLKKDMRKVLTEDQKGFLDELIETVIQHRLYG